MLLNIAFAALLMVMTTAIHAGGMILVMRVIRSKTTGHIARIR